MTEPGSRSPPDEKRDREDAAVTPPRVPNGEAPPESGRTSGVSIESGPTGRPQEALRLLREQHLAAEARIAELARADEGMRDVPPGAAPVRDSAEVDLSAADAVSRAQIAVITATLVALTTEPSLDAFIGPLLKTIVQQLGGQEGALWRSENASGTQRLFLNYEAGQLVRGEEAQHLGRLPQKIPRQLIDRWKNGDPRPIVFDAASAADEPEWAVYCDYYSRRGIKTVLMLPLISGDQLIGNLAVRFIGARTFRPHELELAQALALQATLALHLAQLGEKAQQAATVRERESAERDKAAELARTNKALLAEISERQRAEQMLRTHGTVINTALKSLTTESSLDGFIRNVLKTIVEQLGAIGGALWIPSEIPDSAQVVFNYHLGEFDGNEGMEHPGRVVQRLPDDILRHWVNNRNAAPLVYDRRYIETHPNYAPYREWANKLGVKSVLLVPLTFGDESLGGLSLRFNRDRKYAPEELQLAMTLGQQATLALQMKRLGEKAQQAAVAQAQEKAAREQAATLAEADRALRNSEERWRFALEGAGDGVWDWNVRTDEALFSKRWKEMIGYAEDEFENRGAEWLAHLDPADKPRVLATLQDYFEGRTSNYIVQFRLRCKDGSWKWILARGMVVSRDNDGKPLRMLGTHTDITTEVAAKAALQAEVIERRRAEQLVRAHAALITDTLQSITREPTLEAFIEQVLKTIVEQLGGMGGTFSVPGSVPGTVQAYLHYQDGRVLPGQASDHPARVPQKVPHPSGGWTAQTAEPELLDAEYMRTSPDYDPFREWANLQGVKTVLQFPLLFGGDAFGVLAVRFPIERQFNRDDLELGKALALQGTLAVRLARLSETTLQTAALQERERAAQQRVGELDRANAALQRTLSKLVGAQDLTPLLEHILREAGDVAQARMATIFLHDQRTDTLSLTWCVRDGAPVDVAKDPRFEIWRKPVPALSSKAWNKIAEAGGYSWFSYDDESYHTPPYALEWQRSMGHQAILPVPLLVGDQALGFMALFFDHSALPVQEHVEFARVFAHQAAAAIQLARLGEQARQAAVSQERERAAQERVAQLALTNDALTRTLDRLASESSLDAALGHVMVAITQQLGAVSAALWLYDIPAGVSRLHMTCEGGRIIPGSKSDHPYVRVPLSSTGTNFQSRTLDGRLSITVVSPENGFHLSVCEYHWAQGVHSILSVPMMAGGEMVGCYLARLTEDQKPDAEQLELARVLAQQATLLVQVTRVTDLARQAAVSQEREQVAREQTAALETLNEALRNEIAERQRAEQLARANAAVISTTLGSIREDAAADVFVAQVLKILVEQLGGIGGALWMAGSGDEVGRVVLNYHLGIFQRGAEIDHPGGEPSKLAQEEWQKWNRNNAEPLVLDSHHIAMSPRYERVRSWAQKLGLKTVLLVPLVFGDESMGTLAVRFTDERRFSAEEMQLVRALALQATLSLQLAHLGEQAKQAAVLEEREQAAHDRAAELANANSVLQESLAVLASQPELDRFLEHVLAAIAEPLHAHSCVLLLLDEASGSIRLHLSYREGVIQTAEELDASSIARSLEASRGDPAFRAEFESPVSHVYVDVSSTDRLPEGIRQSLVAIGARSAISIPVLVGERLLGRFAVRFDHQHEPLPGELELLQALAHQVALALHLASLGDRGRKSAVLEERNRMARDIHDTLAQGFTGVIIQLEAATDALVRRRSKETRGHIQSAVDLARQSLAEARRSVHALKTLALENADLRTAFEGLFNRMTAGTGIRAHVSVAGVARPLPADWEEHLFHIGREALTNAIRHAHPKKFVATLSYEQARVTLALRDDGSGFDPATAAHRGIGLIGMHERAAAIGARMQLHSEAGKGTEIVLTLER